MFSCPVVIESVSICVHHVPSSPQIHTCCLHRAGDASKLHFVSCLTVVVKIWGLKHTLTFPPHFLQGFHHLVFDGCIFTDSRKISYHFETSKLSSPFFHQSSALLTTASENMTLSFLFDLLMDNSVFLSSVFAHRVFLYRSYTSKIDIW